MYVGGHNNRNERVFSAVFFLAWVRASLYLLRILSSALIQAGNFTHSHLATRLKPKEPQHSEWSVRWFIKWPVQHCWTHDYIYFYLFVFYTGFENAIEEPRVGRSNLMKHIHKNWAIIIINRGITKKKNTQREISWNWQ